MATPDPSGAVGLVRWSPDSRGPAAQLLGAQLRITTRVLASYNRSRYPYYRVPTNAVSRDPLKQRAVFYAKNLIEFLIKLLDHQPVCQKRACNIF